MIWHSTDKDSVIKHFAVDPNAGLDAETAAVFYNADSSASGKVKLNFLSILLKQFRNKIYILLLLSAVVSAILEAVLDKRNYTELAVIVLVTVVFAVYSAYREYGARRIFNEAKSVAVPTCSVLRSGEIISIAADKLVPSDIILLKAGDYIPADARLIESTNLRCDEYILTGEVVDVEKDCNEVLDEITDVANRKNMVFAGCSVVHGTGKAIVTEIGKSTEISKKKLLTSGSRTELEKKLTSLCKYFGIFVYSVCMLAFVLQVIMNLNSTENFALLVVNSFVNAVSLSIAAMPETLPIVAIATVAIGINQISKNGALVRNIKSIEKCANVSVICADKNAVFTEDTMRVKSVFDGKNMYNTDSDELSDTACRVIEFGMMCSKEVINADLCGGESDDDSTDKAISEAAVKYCKVSPDDIRSMFPVMCSIPFDSDRMLMSTIHMINGKPIAIIKGAAESLLPLCRKIDVDAALKINDTMTDDALRVIAVGYKPLTEVPTIPNADDIENDIYFAGFIGLEDPISSGSIKSVAECINAGIRTVMITGDNIGTAKAIARRIGILRDGTKAITGAELSKLSDEELDREITAYTVFARVSPSDKYRIVRALQHNNEVVAVTGSKIDSSAALRRADIGFAIEDKAGDIPLKSADILMKNNGFKSIIDTIKGGKTIPLNIKSVSHYLLCCNLAELLIIFLSIAFFRLPALASTQLLLLNLLTDILPVFAIGLAPTLDDNLKNRTRKFSDIFTLPSVIRLVAQSLLITLISLFAYLNTVADSSAGTASTVTFILLTFMQILHAIPSVNQKMFIKDLGKAKTLLGFLGLDIVITLLLVLTPIGRVFGFTQLTANNTKYIVTSLLIFIILDEAIKFLMKKLKIYFVQ